jgi:hypothetical protein
MAQLAVPAVITAATHLMRAAQWTAATDLLRATTTDDPADQRALMLALAEVAVDQDFAQQTDHATPALAAAAKALAADAGALTAAADALATETGAITAAAETLEAETGAIPVAENGAHTAAEALVAESGVDTAAENGAHTAAEALVAGTGAITVAETGAVTVAAEALEAESGAVTVTAEGLVTVRDPAAEWDLDMLNLRKTYSTQLFGRSQRGGTEGGGEELAEWADRLRESAPDGVRRGMACFYAGVITDNLLGKHESAFASYTEALALGEAGNDDLLASLALRHLGDHAHTAGDLKLAREQWERSTELRQKVGHLLGALAQQALLSVLLRDEGDAAGSRALATEVNRWSNQVGLSFITRQTAELIS